MRNRESCILLGGKRTSPKSFLKILQWKKREKLHEDVSIEYKIAPQVRKLRHMPKVYLQFV